MPTLKLKLKDTPSQIEDRLLGKIKLHLQSALKRSASAVQRRMGEVCESLITGETEYHQLLSGTLLGELGIPDVNAKLTHILQTIKRSVTVESPVVQVYRQTIMGGMLIKMIKSDYLDILGLPDASYSTLKGANIPWLDWLLLEGDRIIVVGYDVNLDLTPSEALSSRTGLALMTKGSGWRIPPEYSGVAQDNFITRAFDGASVEALLVNVIKEEILTRL